MNIWAIESRHTMATADAVAPETRPHKGLEWWHMVQTCPVGGPPIDRLHWWTKPCISYLSVLTHFMVKYTFYKVSTARAQEVKRWWKSHHVKWGESIIKWLTKAPLPPASTLIRTLKAPLYVYKWERWRSKVWMRILTLCILLFKTPVAAVIVFQHKKLSLCLLLKSAAHFPCENKSYKYIQKCYVKRFCSVSVKVLL